MSQQFILHPFEPLEVHLELSGAIARFPHRLAIAYTLTGDLTTVEIAPPADQPQRRHQLWQHTCFEFFLGIPQLPRYWEFNLSPAGHWNSYRFDNYRQGMAEEGAFKTLPVHIQQQPDRFSLELEVDLAAIALADHPFDVAITAVIQDRTGEVRYWALTHPGAEADFHRRDSFVIQV